VKERERQRNRRGETVGRLICLGCQLQNGDALATFEFLKAGNWGMSWQREQLTYGNANALWSRVEWAWSRLVAAVAMHLLLNTKFSI